MESSTTFSKGGKYHEYHKLSVVALLPQSIGNPNLKMTDVNNEQLKFGNFDISEIFAKFRFRNDAVTKRSQSLENLTINLEERISNCEHVLQNLDQAKQCTDQYKINSTNIGNDSISFNALEDLIEQPRFRRSPLKSSLEAEFLVTGFTKCFPYDICSEAMPFKTTKGKWQDCTSKQLKPVHPICCGPSRAQPMFDAKIVKLEQEIIKYCFDIKRTNILIINSCNVNKVLVCQKNSLHNMLFKLCCKVRSLEGKLHLMKMAICCPNMPPTCSVGVDYRREIENVRRLEDKIELLSNSVIYKTHLKLICDETNTVIKADIEDWKEQIVTLGTIQKELEDTLKKMKDTVCKEKEPSKLKMMNNRANRVSNYPMKRLGNMSQNSRGLDDDCARKQKSRFSESRNDRRRGGFQPSLRTQAQYLKQHQYYLDACSYCCGNFFCRRQN